MISLAVSLHPKPKARPHANAIIAINHISIVFIICSETILV